MSDGSPSQLVQRLRNLCDLVRRRHTWPLERHVGRVVRSGDSASGTRQYPSDGRKTKAFN
eukprot:1848763-Pleurochrysis_carterae.AAC.2